MSLILCLYLEILLFNVFKWSIMWFIIITIISIWWRIRFNIIILMFMLSGIANLQKLIKNSFWTLLLKFWRFNEGNEGTSILTCFIIILFIYYFAGIFSISINASQFMYYINLFIRLLYILTFLFKWFIKIVWFIKLRWLKTDWSLFLILL